MDHMEGSRQRIERLLSRSKYMGTRRSLRAILCILAIGVLLGVAVRIWPRIQGASYAAAAAILLIFGLLAAYVCLSRVVIRHKDLKLVFELTTPDQCELHIKSRDIRTPLLVIRLLERLGPDICAAQRTNGVSTLVLDSPLFAQKRLARGGVKRYKDWADLVEKMHTKMFPGARLEPIAAHNLNALYRLRLGGMGALRSTLVSRGFRVVVEVGAS